ncbi:hypothetical protein [Leptolyngbya sp. FACHB-261]|uniref:hypothetical protein n=1 Tax=Leptolyngbya sp. FACHB-261 TaxID=2692806 RepID=UPI00168360C2|nr:hypothetical protein [Leptolyngbya sp. FACHB-261]MBD2103835.1 hypothetical protein [Leptolyngbya sp. FACHB-261]
MKSPHKYVLLLNPPPEDLYNLTGLLDQINCPFAVASSLNQELGWNREGCPYLIILGSSDRHWSQIQIQRFRQQAAARGYRDSMVILALTESHATSWPTQDENPGFDGFLVKPLSADILASLVESAWVRQLQPCIPVN